MKFRNNIVLGLCLISLLLSSACTSVESNEQEEVFFDSGGKSLSKEVVISNSDFNKENLQVSSVQQSGELPKRTLADKSEVETLLDAFGNKVETRYFPNNPRIQSVMVRTAADGKVQVTVYGYGSDTRIVAELDGGVLTASADEISNAAKLTGSRAISSGSQNFMKNSKSQEAALQPLPSSSFQRPSSQINLPTETVQPETTNTSENPSTQSNEEDED